MVPCIGDCSEFVEGALAVAPLRLRLVGFGAVPDDLPAAGAPSVAGTLT